MSITLVLGGARSGKSMHAQRAAESAATGRAGQLIMIATAEAFDDEMRTRIKQHQQSRGSKWQTWEAPIDLPMAISKLGPDDCAVVDCLTLWVSNLLMRNANIEENTKTLLAALTKNRSSLWLVSNEVGFGIVPENALARRFRDDCGRLHQELAAIADSALMLVAGLPLKLK